MKLKRLKLRKNNWMSESYRFDEILVQIGGAAAAGDFGVDRWRPKVLLLFFFNFFPGQWPTKLLFRWLNFGR